MTTNASPTQNRLQHHWQNVQGRIKNIDWKVIKTGAQNLVLTLAALAGKGIRQLLIWIKDAPRLAHGSVAYIKQAVQDYREAIDRLDKLDELREVTRVQKRSTDVGKPIRQGMFVLFMTFGVLGTWAAVAPLAKGAHALGMISLDGNRKSVQHLEGGIVKDIHVREGDHVKAGQVLISLDDTRTRAQFDIFRSRMDELLAQEARLVAEREGLSAISFPAALMERKDDEKVASLIADQRELYEARLTEQQGQVNILNRRMEQYQQQIEGMQSEQTAKEEQLALIKEELVGLKKLLKKGYSSRTRVLALERAAADIAGARGSLVSSIARAGVAIGETELEVLQLQQSLTRDTIDRLRNVRAKMADVEAQVSAADDTLKRSEIRSPSTGQIVGLEVHTKGGVVTPGTTLVSIVPEGERLMVEAEVQTIDIDTVHAGMSAEIRLPGLPMRSTPFLHGTVETISADVLENRRTGQQYYLARVIVPPEELSKLEGVELVPGMPAEVMIKAGERTPLNYLVSPFTRMLNTSMREE